MSVHDILCIIEIGTKIKIVDENEIVIFSHRLNCEEYKEYLGKKVDSLFVRDNMLVIILKQEKRTELDGQMKFPNV